MVLSAALNAWNISPKKKLWIQWKEWKWNQVPWISVCAPTTVHVRVREGGMGGKVEVEKKKKANLHLWNETAHLDVDDKQYKQQQQSIKEDTVNDIKL